MPPPCRLGTIGESSAYNLYLYLLRPRLLCRLPSTLSPALPLAWVTSLRAPSVLSKWLLAASSCTALYASSRGCRPAAKARSRALSSDALDYSSPLSGRGNV
eukprot:scaffold232228_cov28-Tisochrysis_lutea.AAC.1